EILSAAHHQRRHANARREVDWFDFRSLRYGDHATTQKDARLEPRLERRQDRTDDPTQAEAVVGDPLSIDVASCLQIVDRSSQIFRPGDRPIPFAVRTGRGRSSP